MLHYVTSNNFKFNYAIQQLTGYDIPLKQAHLDLDEIQSDAVDKIAQHKATAAYQALQVPLLVSDAEWHIPALNGFPGAFMAYVDQWLSTDDFLRLMTGIEDRRIIYTEVLVYIDSQQQKLFRDSAEGLILHEGIRSDFKAIDPIVSFRADGKSLSQARLENLPTFDNDLTIWKAFGNWFITL